MKLRNRKTYGAEDQDDMCNICFRVKYDPKILQPCLHSFSRTCLDVAFKNDIRNMRRGKCQYCRSVIHNVIQDDELVKRLKKQYPIDFAERRVAEENAKRRMEEKRKEEQGRIIQIWRDLMRPIRNADNESNISDNERILTIESHPSILRVSPDSVRNTSDERNLPSSESDSSSSDEEMESDYNRWYT